MKTTFLHRGAPTLIFGVLVLSSALCPPSSVFAQGPLTPPGAPAPTMKSLDQIEPRTPISALPITISSGGGYYLTKNLNIASGDAITISVSGVTLDLNGFEITSTEPSPAHSGVLINSGLRNIRIMNGQIRGNVTLSGSTFSGSGFANGIQTTGTAPVNAHVSDVSVAGCLSAGINLGASGLVESCTVSVIGGTGITADNVLYCNAYNCGSVCISANFNVTGCYANPAPSAFSTIQSGGMATGCYAFGNPSPSQATIECQIARDCFATTNSGAGDAIYANTAENCNGFAFGTGSGIHCFQSAINCYGTSSGNKPGVDVTGGTALNCYGTAGSTGNGLSARNAENCYGQASGSGTGILLTGSALSCSGLASGIGIGVSAMTATGCYGTSTSGIGVDANVAINCEGGTGASQGEGLSALNAQNCYGFATANSGTTNGLRAVNVATNCLGSSSTGAAELVSGYIAIGCAAVHAPAVIAPHAYFCGSGAATYP